MQAHQERRRIFSEITSSTLKHFHETKTIDYTDGKKSIIKEEIMGNKLCPKVILEGTRLTLKTVIAFEINEDPRVVAPRKDRYS